MGKKKAANQSKAAAKQAKKAKAAQKIERREIKKVSKNKQEYDDDDDLEGILEKVSGIQTYTPGSINECSWCFIS